MKWIEMLPLRSEGAPRGGRNRHGRRCGAWTELALLAREDLESVSLGFEPV